MGTLKVELIKEENLEEYVRLARIDALIDRIKGELDGITALLKVERHRHVVEKVLEGRKVK